MIASDLRDLLVTMLARKAAGNRQRWRKVVGEVKVYSTATHAHCNWSVTPSGSLYEMAEVERFVDDLRLAHPIVSAG